MNRFSSRFPRLPLLDYVSARAGRLDGVMIVAVQHLLESTGSLLESFITLGVASEDIHILGKLYSTSVPVAQALSDLGISVYPNTVPDPWPGFAPAFIADLDDMWSAVVKALANRPIHTLIILDDGGRCLARMPSGLVSLFGAVRVASVEQTTGGLSEVSRHCPRVRVADSAIKRYLESPMIASTIFEKLASSFSVVIANNWRVGIVGMGNIGQSIAEFLLKENVPFCVYDRDENQLVAFSNQCCTSLCDLINRSDFIFGCTGVDIFFDTDWNDVVSGDRTLVSCSSEDKEFNTLLRIAAQGPSLSSNVDLHIGALNFSILRGGFPINFDGSATSVPNHSIQLTRSLLLAGVLQAVDAAKDYNKVSVELMLDPVMQSLIACHWFASEPGLNPLTLSFDDIDWITGESGPAIKPQRPSSDQRR